MRGIVVGDFETLIKNSDIVLSDINEKLQSLRTASLNLRRSIRSADLSFLTDNIYANISENSKIVSKVRSYNTVIRSALTYYRNQEQEMASTMRRATPLV